MGKLSDSNSYSVLFAMPEADTAGRVRSILSMAGVNLFIEETLSGALDVLKCGCCDLILLDLGRIENGGVETLVNFRSAAEEIPIVIVCDACDAAKEDRIERLGAQACLDREMFEENLVHTLYSNICAFRVKREIKAAHRCIEKLVGEAQDAILVLDQTGNIRFANEAARRLFMQHCEELAGRTFGYPAITGDVTEVDVLRNDGEIRSVEMRVSNTEWNSGPAKLVILRDITERKLAELELRKARDELEKRVEERTAQLAEANRQLVQEAKEREVMAEDLRRSNEELQQFAFIASHDLKEPLRKILTFSNLINAGASDSLDEKTKDYLQRIGKAVRRMQVLIDSLLRYCHVSASVVPFQRVSLREIVEEVISDLEFQVETSGARIEIDDLPEIDADPQQMRQLFQNLVQNAIKFRGSSSPIIRIWAEAPSLAKPDLEGYEFPDGMFSVLVEDNGIGFDEQHAEKIFGFFQRLHGKDEYEGTGMGLAICKRIVERHGGTITAKSTPGKGATFITTLPGKQVAVVDPYDCG